MAVKSVTSKFKMPHCVKSGRHRTTPTERAAPGDSLTPAQPPPSSAKDTLPAAAVNRMERVTGRERLYQQLENHAQPTAAHLRRPTRISIVRSRLFQNSFTLSNQRFSKEPFPTALLLPVSRLMAQFVCRGPDTYGPMQHQAHHEPP